MSELIYEASCGKCDREFTIAVVDVLRRDGTINNTPAWMNPLMMCPFCENEMTNSALIKNLNDWRHEAGPLIESGKIAAAITVCRKHTGKTVAQARDAVRETDEYKKFLQIAIDAANTGVSK